MTKVAPWPWSFSAAQRADFAGGLRSLLKQVEGLPVIGWESSCRLSPTGLRPDRLLLGFSPAGVAARRLQALPTSLGMPASQADSFLAAQGEVSQILLAIEQTHDYLELKVYLSFASRLGAVETAVVEKRSLAMRGYKWHPGNPDRTRTSDYWRQPVTIRRLQEILEQREGVQPAATPAYAVAACAVWTALAARPYWHEGDFLTTTEQASERSSCSVRLYESGLRVVDLQPALAILQKDWLFSDDKQCIERMGQRPLGWIQVGVDGQGEPFVTLYCEASRTDAQQALSLLLED
ncbi:hypothetical protein [Candidatus Magnetaquicoccus inordinatus]|uniref:hypothetical protein n=1 Tax=Candidatus Magnetaquicoccus inordinatus TaxID=2496818 RepID=UPI00102C4BAE|nr:hypothetical protein [Candidatus Magnetaquicoccus inordinatus]